MAPPFLTPFRMSSFEFRVGLLSGLQYFGDTPVLWCVAQFPLSLYRPIWGVPAQHQSGKFPPIGFLGL